VLRLCRETRRICSFKIFLFAGRIDVYNLYFSSFNQFCSHDRSILSDLDFASYIQTVLQELQYLYVVDEALTML
jgi:hypothetical protein